jgi:hypothetical protein
MRENSSSDASTNATLGRRGARVSVYAVPMARSSRRRRIVLGVLAVPLLLVLAFVLRVTVFVPRFDVASIAQTPAYQDAALLDRSWALPVAMTYAKRVDFQSNGSVCGPASAANLFRSLGEPAVTQDAVLEGSGKCGTGMCFMGLTLDELADVMKKKTKRTITIVRDLSLDTFRAEMKRANDPARRYLINFHRGLLFGKGTGHHSPIGGYLEAEDLVFVLDVNGAFKPWLVTTKRLFQAMDSVDDASGKKRGLLVVE